MSVVLLPNLLCKAPCGCPICHQCGLVRPISSCSSHNPIRPTGCTCDTTAIISQPLPRTREEELRDALRGLEWAGTIWTDTAVCLFCGNLRDGANLKNPPETYPPYTHKADCEWKRLTETR